MNKLTLALVCFLTTGAFANCAYMIPAHAGSTNPNDTESKNRYYQAVAEAQNQYSQCMAMEALQRQQLQQLQQLQRQLQQLQQQQQQQLQQQQLQQQQLQQQQLQQQLQQQQSWPTGTAQTTGSTYYNGVSGQPTSTSQTSLVLDSKGRTIGNITYYNIPGLRITAKHVGNMTYYNYSDGRPTVTGQTVGNMTYFNTPGRPTVTAQTVGGTTYYNYGDGRPTCVEQRGTYNSNCH